MWTTALDSLYDYHLVCRSCDAHSLRQVRAYRVRLTSRGYVQKSYHRYVRSDGETVPRGLHTLRGHEGMFCLFCTKRSYETPFAHTVYSKLPRER